MIPDQDIIKTRLSGETAKMPFEPLKMKVVDIQVDKGYALSGPPKKDDPSIIVDDWDTDTFES